MSLSGSSPTTSSHECSTPSRTSFGGGALRSLRCRTLGFFLSSTCLLFGSAARLLLSLALSHFLRGPLRSFLLGTHLLLGDTPCLLLGALHFSFLLTTCLLLSLPLRHFLSSLLSAHLLLTGLFLGTLHFSFLLTTCLLFSGLALGHLLSGSLRSFLLGTHLLLFSGPTRFVLLALHGGGFSLCLLSACGFRCGLFIGHPFSRSTLLLHCQILLLLRRSGLLGGRPLLLSGGLGLLACFFNLSGPLLGCHTLLLGGSFYLLATFLNFSGCLLRSHALLLSDGFRLLRSVGLHAGFFGFSRCRCLFGSPFLCHRTFFRITPLAVWHRGALGRRLASMPAGIFTAGISRRLFNRRRRHGCRWHCHDGGRCPFRLNHSSRPRNRFSGLALHHCWHGGCHCRRDWPPIMRAVTLTSVLLRHAPR
ncbi:MAG: hypothetical protein JWR15_141 [Prosthecobacter sp.]|nr:hypothetical protein [Prosthecobacter sp.]